MSQLKKIVKPVYEKIFGDFKKTFKKELSGCDSVLDLGCGGNSLIQLCDARFKVGVELFDQYIEESKKKGIHNQYIKEDVTKVDFPPKSFDAVMMIDVLEHITREDGLKLLAKMESWAKKKIIIYTPNGFIENDCVDNNVLQAHKSGWKPEDFKKLGFRVYGGSGWKQLRGKATILKYKPEKLFLVLSDMSQKIVYYFPEVAFHIFAVKDIKKN